MDKLTTGVAYGTSAGNAGFWALQLWAAVRRTTSRSPAARSGASVTSPRMTRPTIPAGMKIPFVTAGSA